MNPRKCVTVCPDTDGHHHQPDTDVQHHLHPQEQPTPSTHGHCLGAESVCASAVSKLLLLVATLPLSHSGSRAPAHPNGGRSFWQTATLAAPRDSVFKAGTQTAQKAGRAARALPLHTRFPPAACTALSQATIWVCGSSVLRAGQLACRGSASTRARRLRGSSPALRCTPVVHTCQTRDAGRQKAQQCTLGTGSPACPQRMDAREAALAHAPEVDRVDQVRDFF